MEVGADLCERVLWGFTLKVAQCVDAAALDRGPGPHQPNRTPQAGVARCRSALRPQPPRGEIVEAALPRREQLACAQLQGKQVLAPIGKGADAPCTGTLLAFPGLRMRRAKPSRQA